MVSEQSAPDLIDIAVIFWDYEIPQWHDSSSGARHCKGVGPASCNDFDQLIPYSTKMLAQTFTLKRN